MSNKSNAKERKSQEYQNGYYDGCARMPLGCSGNKSDSLYMLGYQEGERTAEDRDTTLGVDAEG